MKRIHLLLIALIVAIAGSTANAQNKMFDSLAKMDGVTSIYVGKPMLKIAGNSANLFGNMGFDASSLLSKLDAVEVITCDEGVNTAPIVKAMQDLLASMKDLEVVTEINNNDSGNNDADNVSIYLQSIPGTDRYKALIVAVFSNSEPTLVALSGDFTADDIASVMQGL